MRYKRIRSFLFIIFTERLQHIVLDVVTMKIEEATRKSLIKVLQPDSGYAPNFITFCSKFKQYYFHVFCLLYAEKCGVPLPERPMTVTQQLREQTALITFCSFMCRKSKIRPKLLP
ncbi:hypothetical protein LOAG_03114 [Loa loa]|uniref:Uncharacterized protein n=1 Tax=Loa loa TaxID=7209 RepID=A0A1S0U5Y7_LOALO|nr:hypothetical protein LOAG_03114 [Loa loa]EFO25366.1 hypothetical protein LOAG_03114 [Loa loa]